MADSTLNRFLASGTAAERAAFVPVPPTPASGPDPSYFWLETDTGDSYSWDFGGAAWVQINTAGGVPDPIVPGDGTQNITGALAVSGAISGSNLSGTNTGDQTSIVGITGSLAEFNTALTGADFATGGGTVTGASSGTNTGDQTSIVGITGTIAQFNTACTDADFSTGGGTATGTNTGDQTITLTGPVTGSGTGSFATTITNDAVTLAMMANVATGTVFYRKTAATGDPEVQTLATLKTDLGLTGTNSGDQTITLTSDVTGSGTGSFATTIAAGVVTLAKMANIATDRLIGRDTAGTGVPEALTVGGGVEFTGAGGIQTSALTGDVTKTAGGTATTIANNAVSFAKFVAAPSVGVVWATGAANYSHNASGGGTANFLRADGTWAVPPGGGGYTPPTGTGFPHITAGSQDAAAKLVDTADVNDAQITLAKMANIATDRLIGRDTAATGVPEALTVSGGIEFTGSGGIQTSAFTGDVTKSAGGTATTIASNAVTTAKILDDNVTLAKIANAAANSKLLGSGATGSGSNYVEITLGTNLSMSGTTLNASGGGSVAWGAITGTLTDQTDLDTALDAKAPNASPTFTGTVTAQIINHASGVSLQYNGSTKIATAIDGISITGSALVNGGTLNTTASSTSLASLNVPHGTAPSAPTNGDMWTTTSGLFARINGSTVGPYGTGGGSTPTGTGFRHVTAGAEDAAAKLVETADITDANVTLAKIANVAANRILARAAGTSGVLSEIAIGPSQVVGRASSGNIISFDIGTDIDSSTSTLNVKAFTGDVTKTLGGTALTIANGVVSGAKLTANGQVRCITFIIDGGGSAITTGIKGDLEIPFACTITGWTLLLDQSGSIVVDIWKDTYANYPPVVGDSITASDKPTVSATTKGQDLAPTGWTTAIAAGDTLRFNVDSITTATRATLSIRVNVT